MGGGEAAQRAGGPPPSLVRPGVLCIGGGAYAMSTAKGVGINLATEDALATANILGPTFAAGGSTLRHLRRVQRRRELPARAVQAFQVKCCGTCTRRVVATPL